jgi:oligoendopeptidase F
VSNIQNEVKPLPKRAEIPVELTWDLTPVYASDADWEADFQKLEKDIEPFESLKSTLAQSPQSLLKVLQQRDETGILFGKLRSYAHLRQSEDNGNAEAQARADRVDMLGTRRAAATAWIEPEILSLSPEQLQEFVAQEPSLKLYEYYLHTLEIRRPHVRSAEVEDVLAQAYESMYGTANVFTLFNNADLKFPKIKDERGEEVELTKGRYINFLESTDRRVREDAFRTMHGEYHKWRNTLAATISGAVKAHVCNARVRSYPSSLHSALGENEIPVEVYHNLLSTVRERLPVLHRYLRLRKKLLKLDELQMWDLYVPMLPDVERAMTYEESQKAVVESARPLGEEYVKVLQGGFDARWVDVPENEGKTSGAYSDGSYVTPPYILMNWQDRLDSTFTLAHEFGHSLHSFFTRQAQPYIYSGYTIFVAEVASTLSESLLTHYLLQKAREANDKPLQLSLLNQYAERFRATLYRQAMFAEFELLIHEIVERNEALTAEAMSEKYLQINKDYYGAEVNVDDSVAIEWARIPHFYYDFYVYQYATGISAAAALSKQILEEGEPAVQRYLNFLRGGSSDNSINLLRGAGVDMATPQPIHQALDVFEDIIAQMEALAE